MTWLVPRLFASKLLLRGDTTMINEDIAQEILGQLFSSLEALEMQSAAVLQFLKDKGIASDQELAVHFEQAGKASSVRWRAARVRIDHLLSSAIKASAKEAAKPEQAKSSEDKQKPAVKATRKTSHGKDEEASFRGGPEKETQATEKAAASGKSEMQQEPQVTASASRNQDSDKTDKNREQNSNRKADAPSGKVV